MNNQFKGGLQTQSHEITVEELSIKGNIPKWLVGSLVRNTLASDGYTVDREVLLNNYAVEPEMYINEPGGFEATD